MTLSKEDFCAALTLRREVDDYGTVRWFNADGVRHRVDGPAVTNSFGTKRWYLNGERHRTDGPAIEFSDGTKYWYLNGRLHREDGPAIEKANGSKQWYKNGKQVDAF